MPGWNPKHGYDTGAPPPGFPPNVQGPPVQYFNPATYSQALPPQVYSVAHVPPPVYPVAYPPTPRFIQPTYYYPPPPLPPQNLVMQPPPPPPPAAAAAIPQIINIQQTVPASPSGYRAVLAPAHCKMHVFQTPRKPWKQPGAQPYSKITVPTGTTVKALMLHLQCTGATARKNKLYEVTGDSSGGWVGGLCISVDLPPRVFPPGAGHRSNAS